MRKTMTVCLTAGLAMAASLAAQDRPLSPRGTAQTQVAGAWTEGERPSYEGGKWIEIDYGRPILRGREDLFGSGESYGQRLNAGAPVWRVGANKSTRFMTEADLKFGDETLPAGEYSMFVDLAGPEEWTLIFSEHVAMERFDREDTSGAIWGSYGYKPEMDVLRAPMEVETIDLSVDQLTIGFIDMTQQGGELAVWWDDQMASVPFSVAE